LKALLKPFPLTWEEQRRLLALMQDV